MNDTETDKIAVYLFIPFESVHLFIRTAVYHTFL